MIESDTIKLLKECNQGIKMGMDSIKEVMDKIKSEDLKYLLKRSLTHHEALLEETQKLLNSYKDAPDILSPVLKGMAWLQTNMKLAVDESDSSAASLLTGGCDNGIKHLSRYLNQYTAADEKSKSICKELIAIEEELSKGLREYL